MPDLEVDAEDGEVRETPLVEEKRDERRRSQGDEHGERHSKKHKSDRDRSRSRDKSRVDRERDREKRVSYDQVSYSGEAYDRYDRYAAATAEARDFAKTRKDRSEKDERSRRPGDHDKESEVKEREKRRERDDVDKERRRERDEKRSEDLGDKDRRKDRDRGREKERSRSRDRARSDKDVAKKAGDDVKDREHRREDRGELRRRSRSRDRNKSRDGSDKYDDRHDRKKDRGHGRERDGGRSSGATEDVKTPRDSHDKEDVLLPDDEDDLEKIRQKRAAILEKIKSKSAANGQQAAGGPGSLTKNQSQEDIFEEQKVDDQKAHDSGEDKPAQIEVEEIEDKDEIDTANVFAAKEQRAESDEDGQDDMFTNSPVKGRTGGGKVAPRPAQGEEVDRSGLEEDSVDRRLGDTNADNWDDSEGYFRTRPGELIIGRYLVNRDIGNGVYSTVLSATDQQTGREVAIKIVRSNETMTCAGRKEIEILKKLGAEDPDGRRHICKLLSHFEYKNHLCMVFVPLEMNLRKLLKTYGREVGITLSAIRQYTRQLLIGLQHMVKCKVVHGDIKLDNIVITKDLKNVAICDFGTADWESECVITPYMVSRYYRPPEICLGLRYGYPMDLWSVGVCLFELYTGKFMFTGRNNNDMLKQFMDYKGAPNKRFLKKGQFYDQHFEEEKGQVVFKWLTQDKVTKAEIIDKKIYDKPVKSIYEQLRKVRSSSDDAKKVKEFADLLEQIFIMDPLKRISVSEALKHPFLR